MNIDHEKLLGIIPLTTAYKVFLIKNDITQIMTHVILVVLSLCCKWVGHSGARLGQAGLFCSHLSLWEFRR